VAIERDLEIKEAMHFFSGTYLLQREMQETRPRISQLSAEARVNYFVLDTSVMYARIGE